MAPRQQTPGTQTDMIVVPGFSHVQTPVHGMCQVHCVVGIVNEEVSTNSPKATGTKLMEQILATHSFGSGVLRLPTQLNLG